MEVVTYKIAKKLNEKGFTLPKSNVIGKFDSDGVFHSQLYINFTETMDSEEIIAPTITQVLKWLREKKVISVEPCATPYNCWYYMIKYEGVTKVTYTNDKYKTYELAALAGIEYVIDNNLI